MKRLLFVVCLTLASSLAAADYQLWPGARFEHAVARNVATHEIYPDGSPDFPARLPLTLVLLNRTHWSESRALRHVRKTAAIFSACEIELAGVRLARVSLRDGRHDIDMKTLVPGSDLPAAVVDIAARIPVPAPWPRIFFVGRLVGDNALARSYRRGAINAEHARRYPYMNTAWIAYRAHWAERSEDRYSSLAHELAHLLCECGHSGGERRHLLHESRNFLGTAILEEDCRRMRSSPLLSFPPSR